MQASTLKPSRAKLSLLGPVDLSRGDIYVIEETLQLQLYRLIPCCTSNLAFAYTQWRGWCDSHSCY
jgi:hypothetical protein